MSSCWTTSLQASEHNLLWRSTRLEHPPVLCSILTLTLERGATNVLSGWHLLNMQSLDAFVNSDDTLGHPDSITGVCDLLVTTF